MKQIVIIILLLGSLKTNSHAQNKNDIRLQLGFGRNFVINQIKHNDIFYDFIYEDLTPSLNNHFSFLINKKINKNIFITTGVEVDFAKYTFKTTGVPDTSFANTSFTFEHKYTTIDLPIGIGKTTTFLKKNLIFSGGLGFGFYFNRNQSATSNIDIINYNKEELAWESNINIENYLKINATVFARVQYKVLNYNCNSTNGGVWLELLAKQTLLHNTNVTSYAAFIFPDRPQPNEVYFTNNFKNRPTVFSFSVLLDLK